MKAIAVGTGALLLMLGTVVPLFADDVSVKGYFRKACGLKHADLSRLPQRRTSDV